MYQYVLIFVIIIISNHCFVLQSLIQHTDAEHLTEVLFNLILHEVSHALGFSQSQFQK